MSSLLRRIDMYKLVWSRPISQLAREFQVTETLIRSICQKYEIPLPKSGHWSKVKFGKKVNIPPLSTKAEWEDLTIDLHNPPVDQKTRERLRLANKMKEIESQCPLESIAQKRLVNPDKLVSATSKHFQESGYRSSYPDKLCHTGWDHLAIAVTKENIPRALRFMNSLIRLLRARGHKIQTGHRATALIVDGETHEVKLLEKCNRRVVKEDRWRQTELVPTGILALKLAHAYSTVEWADGKQSLEQQLVKIGQRSKSAPKTKRKSVYN